VKVILEFDDMGSSVVAGISEGFVIICENNSCVYLTLDALARIAEAAAEDLEDS
jgi:hypothetical protein